MAASLKPVPSSEPPAFVIETGIPVPDRFRHNAISNAVSLLAEAAVGASVFIPGANPWALQQAAWRLGGKGWVATRKSGEGYRAWKIAEPKRRA